MHPSKNKETVIQLSPEGLRINGNSEIILCASLFYFRLPRGLWKDRLHKVKAFGYNAIDVYFPWNHHEMQEGVWDFHGEKDAAQFLQDAADAGLWVIARPGPYICSEWDGGALPAYLFVKDNLQLRQNDPLFLQYVSKWYAQILPIIRKFEQGRGGTVIAVQLDNELDFYPCADPKGYISAVRDLAVQQGITVPMIACAGQGGLYEASGFSEDVVPTCNFYPNDRDPVFEEKVLYYREELARRGYPLLVTETNRSHFLLRRLLSAGAKLLGPYLQASGTNYGFTNAANNWGNPLSFLTSDYDFHGMITPEGHIREEAYEGRLLQQVIQTYGRSLAEACPLQSQSGPYRLSLKQGGELVFVCNTNEKNEDVYIAVRDETVPCYSTLVAEAGYCPILPMQVPLQLWGISDSGLLDYSTAELLRIKRLPGQTLLVFHTEGVGEIRFSFGAEFQLAASGMQVPEETENRVTLVYSSAEAEVRASIQLSDGHLIEVIGMSRSRALLLEDIDEAGVLQVGALPERSTASRDVEITWTQSKVNPVIPLADAAISIGNRADYLEKHATYRGFAWYAAQLPSADQNNPYQGVIVQQASDVVSVYSGTTYLGTATPGGASYYLPISAENPVDSALTARVEIWGHTNFHDTNLPGLHLNSLKGLTGMIGVTSTTDLNSNWRFRLMQTGENKDDFAQTEVDDHLWPIVSIGGWLSAEQPAHQCYRKQVKLKDQADTWLLHASGSFTYAYAYVNGHALGLINPLDPFIDVTPYVKAGETAALTLYLDKTYGSLSGQLTLYEGMSSADWTLAASEEKGLLEQAEALKSAEQAVEGPISLAAGALSWLYGQLPDDNHGLGWRVYVKGSDMKLTVFFNGHLVGRLWTQGGANRAIFRGGSDDSFYLPGPWFRDQEAGNDLVILLESVARDEAALLEPLRFVPVAAI
ncbi:beta-galactosidase [Paenibacillus alba]|uniref:Beta-galactosidase n=1 Tax=Paenibacillus alba TaxID=1197127 RepID=A0ABU6GD68_9BACL|nr:beta-galactosidase [Paenibacillus alba]MEC0232162.1 beta-galactosidase [Paenibacillus alba]